MTTLIELRDMLREAKGPSLELFLHAICATLAPDEATVEVRQITGRHFIAYGKYSDGLAKAWEGYPRDIYKFLEAEAWTDAALALVERLLPGWEWSVWRVGETSGATVYNTPEDEIEPSISSHAPTAPLAILLALVEALIVKEKADG